ncbi:hypothetical protein Leryth_003699 [Lithospermum erythrorhizon]|uniref:Uncharacterized protein n=1 Tax=Lithospermum erythrorhizon TaxID=34254 RepID=A0AAV3Q4B6_LITER|nr:hypothetical protein Leryth_003699 [Lithospermum erythrorhizon]
MKVVENKNQSRREPSRLQRIAPASLKINREELGWNVAIPLLSPLVASPDQIDFSSNNNNNNCCNNSNSKGNNNQRKEEVVVEKPHVTGKRWQHPAAPFCYEPAPLMAFVCSGGVER